MAETILNGYLINKVDYQVFDEVLTILAEDGNKYSCLSLGSRKIMSKNSRNLFYGSKIEFQFFQARNEQKMSKFKKAILLEDSIWEMQSNKKMFVLNEIISYIPASNTLFSYYENNLKQIKLNEEDDDTFILKLLSEFCLYIGISLEVNKCVRCSSKVLSTISFKHSGMLCENCRRDLHTNAYDIRLSKLIHLLFNKKYDSIHNYYDLFSYAIKCIKQFIFDTAGIKLFSLKEY